MRNRVIRLTPLRTTIVTRTYFIDCFSVHQRRKRAILPHYPRWRRSLHQHNPLTPAKSQTHPHQVQPRSPWKEKSRVHHLNQNDRRRTKSRVGLSKYANSSIGKMFHNTCPPRNFLLKANENVKWKKQLNVFQVESIYLHFFLSSSQDSLGIVFCCK